jgi:hypothetical protein
VFQQAIGSNRSSPNTEGRVRAPPEVVTGTLDTGNCVLTGVEPLPPPERR